MTKQQQIDCEQALEQILGYVDHELGESERTALEHHLHTCKSCFSRMEFERRLKEKISALREEAVSSGVSERIKGLFKGF